MKPVRLHCYLFSLLSCAILFSGCSVDDDATPEPTGKISGRAVVRNEYGEVQDPSSLVLSVENTEIKTSPDVGGLYTLKFGSLPSGTYDLKISTPGFIDGYRREWYYTRGEPYAMDIIASKAPSQYFVAPTLSLPVTNGYAHRLFLSARLSAPIPAGKMLKAQVFIGKTPNVSATNYIAAGEFNLYREEVSLELLSTMDFKSRTGIKTGETIYVVAYTDAAVPVGYSVPGSNVQVPTSMNTNHAVVLPFVMP
ncbi:hypothetical protein [Sabulibacter ruber]|uniref:hypothetical protein n=1 Tax=Sabulibacter ruber TaxID=2811901 RepID=UPI001A957A18|nr:hypothetical protein [Sabulibacter ruber]